MKPFPQSNDKHEWRIWAKTYRKELDIPNAFKTIEPVLVRLDEWRNAGRILLYFATATEITVNDLLGSDPSKEWYLPRCAVGNTLAVHRAFSGSLTMLHQSSVGIYEPHQDTPAVMPETLDLAVVPALIFDERGYRLGYGGGYYDRFLPRLRPDCVTVGITLDTLVVPALPAESHDRCVQIVVTESRVIRQADTTISTPPPCSD